MDVYIDPTRLYPFADIEDGLSQLEETATRLDDAIKTYGYGCRGWHRDVQLWNHQKVECCLSCGTLIIALSDLHDSLQFSDEIRLLRLLPASDARDDLVAELIHARLGDKPDYDAVSYTWADKRGITKHSGNLFIKSRDGVLKITSNCEAMLRRFRDKDYTKTLWVDAICIDQKNSLERSEQVQAMTAIYKQAQMVLVFIGNPPWNLEDDYHQLFKFIQSSGSTKRCLDMDPMDLSWRSPVEDILSTGRYAHLQQILLKFFRYPWFHRVWVIQEVVMGQAVLLHFGPHVIDWKDMALDPRNDKASTIRELEHFIALQLPPVLRLSRDIRSDGAYLPYLLSVTRACAATDPRDKVFALLGMAKVKAGLQLPRADYSKSAAVVFHEASLYCFRCTNTLEMLSLVSLPTRAMPSWVLDFADTYTPPPLPKHRKYLSLRQMDKLNSEKSLGKPVIIGDCISNAAHLNAEGILLDVIRFVQYDVKEIFRTATGHKASNIEESTHQFKQLLRIPSNDELPSILADSPTSVDIFKTLSPGVDPCDMTAIDLLALSHEHFRSSECRLTLDCFYGSVINFGGGRAVSSGVYTLGIVPMDTQAGDTIWMLSTGADPLVMRCLENRNYRVVGPCTLISPSTNIHNQRSAVPPKHDCNCRSCIGKRTYEQLEQFTYCSISIV